MTQIKLSQQAKILIPFAQLKLVEHNPELNDVRENLNTIISTIAGFRETENVKDKIIDLHYFSPSMDWYIVEFDKDTMEFFGYVNTGYGAELGYTSVTEILENREIELDLYFEPTPWSAVQGHSGKAYADENMEDNKVIEPNTPEEFDEAIFQALDEMTYGNKTNFWEQDIEGILMGSPENKKTEAKRLLALYKKRTQGGVSFSIKDYKNAYELNKAIEKWIDTNIGSLENVSNRNYSYEEKMFLKAYSGYGGLDKYGSTGVGGLFEYYTPIEVIKAMWGLAYKYGYKSNGSVLEPSVGTGEFLQFAEQNTHKVAYEISKYSAIICKVLYPTTDVRLMPFEKIFIEKNFTIKSKTDRLQKFDLVIGNCPYGDFSKLDPAASRYLLGMGEKDFTKATNYVQYFLRRSLDLLKPDGLLVMIVGTQLAGGGDLFLDSPKSPLKEYMDNNSVILDAYRLPDSIFERTGVTSDIIVIQNKRP